MLRPLKRSKQLIWMIIKLSSNNSQNLGLNKKATQKLLKQLTVVSPKNAEVERLKNNLSNLNKTMKLTLCWVKVQN